MKIRQVGIGFRDSISDKLLELEEGKPAFLELAPENWMGIGGALGKILSRAAAKYQITCHGLSLSLGSTAPLDWDFLRELKEFLNRFNVKIYSEHLSFTQCENAHLYELMPLPFQEKAVKHIAERIRTVQDFLERRIAIENVSYYTPVEAEMDEATFINSVIHEADCDLLLDVNNVYVNSFNHKYNATEFLNKLDLSRVAYIHMAGHEMRDDDLIIDTHGNPIIDPVYDLFRIAIAKIEPVPVLLERDYNLGNFDQILGELKMLQKITEEVWIKEYAHS